ncbi:hypothetical protein C8R47DRAFT_1320947 [Mycena vitilis]|nr:hypothetical protein C8R47DRAFT_1320947 [Mycena vitilis]
MSLDFTEDFSEVWQVLVDARTTNSMILGALSLVAFDHLITFQDEVELKWKSRICTTSVVYVRILSLVLAASLATLGMLPPWYVGNVPRYFAFYSVPVLVVSMTMFLMTVYKCGKTLLTHGRAQMPIYNMFLRDGVFWFVVIFMTFIPEVVIWARARQSLAELLIAPGLAVTSIIGSRVLLNIKGLQPPRALPTTTTDATSRLAMGPTVELDTIDYPSRSGWCTVGTVGDMYAGTETLSGLP